MPSPIKIDEFTSAVSSGTVTLTPRVGIGTDLATVASEIAITSTNPPDDFWEANRVYRVTIERV